MGATSQRPCQGAWRHGLTHAVHPDHRIEMQSTSCAAVDPTPRASQGCLPVHVRHVPGLSRRHAGVAKRGSLERGALPAAPGWLPGPAVAPAVEPCGQGGAPQVQALAARCLLCAVAPAVEALWA